MSGFNGKRTPSSAAFRSRWKRFSSCSAVLMPGASLALFADLGDMSCPKVKCYNLRSTRALRVEGDRITATVQTLSSYFYPRPPGGGRPESARHTDTQPYFYPRPPSGGRPRRRTWLSAHCPFLSTPSGWRATSQTRSKASMMSLFLSTPSGWRATRAARRARKQVYISIHALRVESDTGLRISDCLALNFYPRPPGGERLRRGCPPALRR